MKKYYMIDENNRNVWEKMKSVKDIEDLEELLAEEYDGMRVPYRFEVVEK